MFTVMSMSTTAIATNERQKSNAFHSRMRKRIFESDIKLLKGRMALINLT